MFTKTAGKYSGKVSYYRNVCLALAACATFAVMACAKEAPAGNGSHPGLSYKAYNIGEKFGAGNSYNSDINKNGMVTGQILNSSGGLEVQGFQFHMEGTSCILTPGQDTDMVTGMGVGDNGHIVAQVNPKGATNPAKAVIYDGCAVYRDMGRFEKRHTVPFDINERDVVVGYASGYEGKTKQGPTFTMEELIEAARSKATNKAFVWEKGEYEKLAFPRGAAACYPLEINDSDVIAGTCVMEKDHKMVPVIWEKRKPALLELGVEYHGATAVSIDDEGWIAGHVQIKNSFEPQLRWVGYIYHKGRTEFVRPASPADDLHFYDVQDGVAVGEIVKMEQYHIPIIYHEGWLYNLNDLLVNPWGVTLTSANGINIRGGISAQGRDSSGHSQGFYLEKAALPTNR